MRCLLVAVVLAVLSCHPKQVIDPVYRDAPVKPVPHVIEYAEGYDYAVVVLLVQGHHYVALRTYSGAASMIHAESCPCKCKAGR